MKPKENRKEAIDNPESFDACQTPPYAIDPLLPYIQKQTIWECASGLGVLADTLQKNELSVIATSIERGQNFFEYTLPGDFTIVTNPPYSVKYRWMKRCYLLERPFALLLPVETIGSGEAQRMFDEHGIEIIMMDKRVDFIMPEKQLDGTGAQFPVAWFTHGLNIGKQLTFAKLNKPSKNEIRLWWSQWKQEHAEQVKDFYEIIMDPLASLPLFKEALCYTSLSQ